MSHKKILYRNINGYTWASGKLVNFGALCFEGDRVLATAKTAESLQDRYSIDREIDGNANTLLPGLIDAHGHTLELGYSLLNVDLSGVDSIEEAQERIRRHAREHPEKEWIEGFGWDQSRWDGDQFPTAAIIDRVVADRPVWLHRKDSHAGWANSEALRRAGITADTTAPQDGAIVRDEEGKPGGVLVDTAMKMVEDQIPASSEKQDQKALERALQQFRKLGLTAVHDACTGPAKYQLLHRYAKEKKLTARIYAMIDGQSSFYDDWLQHGPDNETYNNHFTVRSVKFFADGALGSRGAALLEPYSDDPENRGILFYRADELAEKISEAVEAGFQVNIHAIGDRANRTVLDAHEKVDVSHNKNLRHRIEHAQILHPEDISRFRPLGLIASIQPAHAMGDMGMVEKRLGEKRMEGAYAWKQLLRNGVTLAAGSDFPIETANPFYGMHTAVNRQNAELQPPGGWYPKQALNRKQAFHAYTLGAAYAAHQEQLVGSLESGKKADFILVNRDPFKDNGDNLLDIKVLQTWVAGRKVYAID